MLKVIVLGLLATVTAAPAPNSNKELSAVDDVSLESLLNRKFAELDAKNRHFWQEFEKEMKTFEHKMQELSKRFPNPILQEGISGNVYRIQISLPGYKEDDIDIKINKNSLVIEAHQKNSIGTENNFLSVKNLPVDVDTGNWTYNNNILSIELKIKGSENADNEENSDSDND